MIISTRVYRVVGYNRDWFKSTTIFQGQIAINLSTFITMLKIRRIRKEKSRSNTYIYYDDYSLEYIGSDDPINYINQI